jgi:hypothetical protein
VDRVPLSVENGKLLERSCDVVRHLLFWVSHQKMNIVFGNNTTTLHRNAAQTSTLTRGGKLRGWDRDSPETGSAKQGGSRLLPIETATVREVLRLQNRKHTG